MGTNHEILGGHLAIDWYPFVLENMHRLKGVLGSIFAEYVPLTSQNPTPS